MDADRRRDLYLDKNQRRKFIEKAPADLAMFLRGLSLLPLRPGALAGAVSTSGDVPTKLIGVRSWWGSNGSLGFSSLAIVRLPLITTPKV